MAASSFSMASAHIHKLLVSFSLQSSSGGGGILSGVKVPSTLRVSRPMAYSLEISHSHCMISYISPVMVRKRTCRIRASLAQDGPTGLIHEQQIPLAQHQEGGENGQRSEEYQYDSAGQLEVGEVEAESEGQSRQKSEFYEQNYPPLIPEGTKLFVGNISFDIDSEGLARIFEEAGVVEMAEVIYDRNTGRSRGFAFVTMNTVQEAEAAIQKFNGSEIGGRNLRVNFPEVPRGASRAPREISRSEFTRNIDSPHKVYVGNLAWSVTSDVLRSAFEGKGTVLGSKVVYDRETGRSRGFGFVSFSSEAELEAVISSMDGVELEGRPMRVNVAQSRPSPYASPMQND